MDLVRLNYGTVEQIIFSVCSGVDYITGKNKDGSATLKCITHEYLDKELLLPAGLDPDEIDNIIEGGESRSGYIPSRLSKFRNEGKLPKKYVAAFSMKPDIYDRVEKSFSTEGSLITFIRDDNMYRAMHELNMLIAADDTIPEAYRKAFNTLCSKDTFWKYLARVFAFAVMRDTNTKMVELGDLHLTNLPSSSQGAVDNQSDVASISMTSDKTFFSKIIGRDEVVQSICKKLKKEREHIQLRGMGGIGKSEILRKVYSWFLENPGEHFYTHIAYLYYSGKFKSDLDNAIDYPGKETNANPIEYLKHLANTSKVLLFIDDVRNQVPDKSEIYEEDASFEEIAGSNISILFASRIMRMDFSPVSVKPLPIESCVEIFLREYNANIDDDIMMGNDTECCTAETLTAEDKERLIRIIDGRAGRNTLVINRLGALARDYGWTIMQLEKELIDRNFNIRQGLSENNAEYMDEQTLQDELNKLYDYNEIKDAAERSILEGFTLLADVPTDIDTCAIWFSRDAEIDEDRCRIALMRLMRRSWLLSTKSEQNEVIVDNYSMHNIVRAAIKAQVEVDREEHQDLVMKVWTNLTIEVRKKDETELKWADRIYAVPGERIRFRIGIRNMSSEMFRNLTLRDILPTGLSYINGSTRIYNPKHPQGVTLSDNIVTDMGVNIGDYAPGANAWIYFDATTPETASNENIIYRNVIQACGGYGAKEQSADVIVDAYEAL